MQLHIGLVTISDRAARGRYADRSGPALRAAVTQRGWHVLVESVVPDEKREIQHAIREQIAQGCHVVLTTGGTGVAPRDVTPEAVREIALRELPGFGEVMRADSFRRTPHALLSRCLGVIVDKSLVLCLPGNPDGAVECLNAVAAAIPHCAEQLREAAGHDERRASEK
jgi:molybdopterin adenylyltransferase